MKYYSKILILLVILLVSCKKDNEKKIKNITKKHEIKLIFHDTVFLNERYDDGRIEYKNILDTLTTDVYKLNKVSRLIDYYYNIKDTVDFKIDFEENNIKNDTAFAETNRVIPLYNIKFNKLGANYIDGVIKDEVYIENGAKDKNGKPMTRLITNEFRLTKKVFVIEAPKSKTR